ncbi:MAG: FR47-like protein [Abditibacteriota bacterium]|nr:FR47-like protein [Abditibacteriota bacterium]
MYERIDNVLLKSGEHVEAAVITGPDAAWRERILELLGHKPPVYNWQNAELLSEEVGVDVRFYILHRDGTPISHMMTTTLQGVGILGHVWTRPDERQKGAASALMDRLMQHFVAQGGQALFLGTGYDSHPYHLYRSRGFEPIEAGRGLMRFSSASYADFEATYFAPVTLESDMQSETQIVPLGWPHWPTCPALFLSDYAGVVRNVALKLFGRMLTEGPLLPLIQSERARRREGEAARAWVLQKNTTGATVGLATWHDDVQWPDRRLVDVYCHPDYWNEAPALLSQLAVPPDKYVIAYADESCEPQLQAYYDSGFKIVTTLPRWLAIDSAQSGYTNVMLLEKR